MKILTFVHMQKKKIIDLFKNIHTKESENIKRIRIVRTKIKFTFITHKKSMLLEMLIPTELNS